MIREAMLEPSAKNQYLAAVVVSMISIGYGINCGWASPTTLLLKSDDSPLPSGTITREEASWIVSLLLVGCFIGNTFFGFAIKKFGRKWPLFYISFPMIISWLLVLFAQNVYYLYVARVLHGFVAGGVIVALPVYLIEISNDRIRGALSSSVSLCGNVGIMLVYVTGNFFHVTPIITIAMTILYAIMFYFFPETPTFLMTQNKISEAEKSVRFYQNIREVDRNSKLLEFEMDRLKSVVGGIETGIGGDRKSMKWSDLVTGPGRKAITIGIVLSALNQFGGCFALLNYSGIIFEESGSNWPPEISTIIVGVIQFFGTCALIFLVDRAGRKFLYIISTLGAVIGFIILGVYMMMKSWHWNIETFNWIPLASFSFIIFSASCAILSLPFTVIGEVMPENIKDVAVTLCTALLSVFGFIVLKFLILLTDAIGFHGSMFLFAGVCSSCALFIVLYMPETKNRSYAEIMKSLQ